MRLLSKGWDIEFTILEKESVEATIHSAPANATEEDLASILSLGKLGHYVCQFKHTFDSDRNVNGA
jgi:hypothetical protein